MSLNVTTLISNLLPMLHSDTTGNLIWWTDAELTRWFADSLKRHAQKDGVFVERSIQNVFAGQAVYNAPARHLDTIHVSINGRPLVASSTTELEALDEGYATTAETSSSPPTRWYADRTGANRIGIYPGPAVGLSDGADLEIIYHGFPCNLDEAHTDTAIDVPQAMGNAIELNVLAEAYATESDAEMPEAAQSARQVVSLVDEVAKAYWGRAQ